ncbi:MAG: hypothetical protein JW795_22110 [Chitinivibrionales bacterium]|nr:hypothetical protein [Chitinivibrionales bacterium]
MKKRILTDRVALCIGIGMMALVLGCGNTSKPDTNDSTKLALDYPVGATKLKIGDTVSIVFRANGDSVSAVSIHLSSDSGRTFTPITAENIPIVGSGAHRYERSWIVGREDFINDTSLLRLYKDMDFGETGDPQWNGKMRLVSSNKAGVAESGDFTVSLTHAMYVRYPRGGETVRYNDTIPVIYMARTDKTSNVERFFYCVEKHAWSPFYTHKSKPKRNNFHVISYNYRFNPSSPALLDPIGDSTKIGINDYADGSSVPKSASEWFKIQRTMPPTL